MMRQFLAILLGGLEGQTLMVGFGWWGCAKLWYNVRYVKEQIGMARAYAPGGFVVFYWSKDTVGRIESALK